MPIHLALTGLALLANLEVMLTFHVERPTFPSSFTSTAEWGCVDASGPMFNKWTVNISYSYPLRMLITDVKPPEKQEQKECLLGDGPPIDGAGRFLFMNGTYFVIDSNTSSCKYGDNQHHFGPPSQSWLQDWDAIYAGNETVLDRECYRWEVDVPRRLGAEKAMWNKYCFQYSADINRHPCRFGGGFCTNGTAPMAYPAGTFLQYIRFEEEKLSSIDQVFSLPDNCPEPSNDLSACHSHCMPAKLGTQAAPSVDAIRTASFLQCPFLSRALKQIQV